jgi:L-alanine-DL-glutamate epimerase-like enolase superfamily enzyme
MSHDVSRYLGPDFEGVQLDRVILSRPLERIPVFHSVGGLDPLEISDVQAPVGDGLPETLDEWIRRDGLVRLKIKLQGNDASWDVERTLAIDRIATRLADSRSRQESDDFGYCLDFNERCPDVEYVIECLEKIRERSAETFERILYIEQPTARDLAANRQNVMHEAARLRPVVIDESLTDLESLLLARDMGYTGVALKACKGQSQAMLMAAAAYKYKMFVCVQDLTCPGASLIHSVGIAARVPAVAGVEANARQYVPAANEPWRGRFPGIFTVTDGYIRSAGICGPGLGISEDMVAS